MITISTLMQRDNGLCHYCDKQCSLLLDHPLSATREHVVPKSRGGSNKARNIVLACSRCNNKRGNRDNVCNCDFCEAAYMHFFDEQFEMIVAFNVNKIWKHKNKWVVRFNGQIHRCRSFQNAINLFNDKLKYTAKQRNR